jgi:hypothetical protein
MPVVREDSHVVRCERDRFHSVVVTPKLSKLLEGECVLDAHSAIGGTGDDMCPIGRECNTVDSAVVPPLSSPSCPEVAELQMRNVGSSEAETKRAPSGENATELIAIR